jgi:hypothetical protein
MFSMTHGIRAAFLPWHRFVIVVPDECKNMLPEEANHNVIACTGVNALGNV